VWEERCREQELGTGSPTRWGSGVTMLSSLSITSSPCGSDDREELVEVTLDLQDDGTIVLQSVELAADVAAAGGIGGIGAPSPSSLRNHNVTYGALELIVCLNISARHFVHLWLYGL
jgi:hypothetical protein